jgi:WXG100 family type VII secretion target
MDGYKVTPEDVSNAAQSCTTTTEEVSAQLSQLRQYVVGMEDWWQGIASDTFQLLMTEYDTYSTMLQNALSDIASGLNGNYVNYANSEQANLKSISGIQAQLGSANLG